MIHLTKPAGAAGSRMIGLGSYRPERRVTNDELAPRIDSSDEWIRERTGIIERRFGSADDTAASMGATAAHKALADAGVDALDIDVVIVATFTHRIQTPSAAAEIGALVGAHNAAAFDISAACAGFCYGVGLADNLIRGGQAQNVLVIGTEKISDFMNFDDRGTAFIFGDGAGAVVISASETVGIGTTIWNADGRQMDAIIMSPDSLEASKTGVPSVLTMQGQSVFRWAVGTMPDVCNRALVAAGVSADDLAAFVPHQANMRITNAILKSLHLPDSVVVARDIEYTGNTSAASIPLAMDALRASGQLKSGEPMLMVGFGAGVAYAAQVALAP